MTDQSHKDITRSAGTIALGTFLSRILGFARDIVIARLFGVYLYAQAFVIAFRIPNLFRDFVGEGATNAAIVPVFSEYLSQKKKEEFWELAAVVMSILMLVLSVIVLAGIFLSPVLVRLIAPGFLSDPEKFNATVLLNRAVFPYILFVGLAAYSMGILNTLKHFASPAFAPCLLNLSIIIFALVFGEGTAGLATGVLAGGILQLAIQIPFLYKKGFKFRFNPDFSHPAVKKIFSLMLPRIYSSCIYQLNNFVDSIFGSLAWIVGEGAVAALYFSYRLVQFPLGIFSNSLSQAFLPAFSRHAIDNDIIKLKSSFSFGLRSVLFVMIPASVGFMVLSRPMIAALFAGGRFDSYSGIATSEGLFFYSVGLFAYGSKNMVQNCFFALQDTRTPAKVATLGLIINIILNALFMYPLKLAGLALATSISGIISFLVLLFLLHKKLQGIDLKGLFFYSLKLALASAVMAAVCYCWSFVIPCKSDLLTRLLRLFIPVITGLAAYILCCLALRIEHARTVCGFVLAHKNN